MPECQSRTLELLSWVSTVLVTNAVHQNIAAALRPDPSNRTMVVLLATDRALDSSAIEYSQHLFGALNIAIGGDVATHTVRILRLISQASFRRIHRKAFRIDVVYMSADGSILSTQETILLFARTSGCTEEGQVVASMVQGIIEATPSLTSSDPEARYLAFIQILNIADAALKSSFFAKTDKRTMHGRDHEEVSRRRDFTWRLRRRFFRISFYRSGLLFSLQSARRKYLTWRLESQWLQTVSPVRFRLPTDSEAAFRLKAHEQLRPDVDWPTREETLLHAHHFPRLWSAGDCHDLYVHPEMQLALAISENDWTILDSAIGTAKIPCFLCSEILSPSSTQWEGPALRSQRQAVVSADPWLSADNEEWRAISDPLGRSTYRLIVAISCVSAACSEDDGHA